MSGIVTLLIVGAVMFCVLGGVTLLAHIYSLNNIKSRTVGDGQHGTARWANNGELNASTNMSLSRRNVGENKRLKVKHQLC